MKNYTVKELSEIFNVSQLTIKRKIKEGKLRAIIGKDYKLHINESDLNDFLNQYPKYKKATMPNNDNDDVIAKLCSTINVFQSILSDINKLDDPIDIDFIIDSCKLNKQALDIIISRLESKKVKGDK